MSLLFRPIDIDRHFAICQQMRSISYLASFGTLDGFERDYGDSYRDRLSRKIYALPEGCCHLWLGDSVIGQTEAKYTDDPNIGYINLLVVKPAFQRQGYGKRMVDYLATVFRVAGKTSMQLSVSPTNHSAMAFYLKHGWRNQGPRPDARHMCLMAKSL